MGRFPLKEMCSIEGREQRQVVTASESLLWPYHSGAMVATGRGNSRAEIESRFLSEWRHDTQLLQITQVIAVLDLLHDLAVLHVDDDAAP